MYGIRNREYTSNEDNLSTLFYVFGCWTYGGFIAIVLFKMSAHNLISTIHHKVM